MRPEALQANVRDSRANASAPCISWPGVYQESTQFAQRPMANRPTAPADARLPGVRKMLEIPACTSGRMGIQPYGNASVSGLMIQVPTPDHEPAEAVVPHAHVAELAKSSKARDARASRKETALWFYPGYGRHLVFAEDTSAREWKAKTPGPQTTDAPPSHTALSGLISLAASRCDRSLRPGGGSGSSCSSMTSTQDLSSKCKNNIK